MSDETNEQTFASFDEFWDFYVAEHKNPWTRRLHFVGTTAAMSAVASAAILRKPSLLLVAAVCGYGPAWASHFFVEGNMPATFKHPLWSLRADLVMWKKMVLFQMDAEVARVTGETANEGAGDTANEPAQTTSAAVEDEPAGTPVSAHASVN